MEAIVAEVLMQDNYVSLAIATAVAYDYFLLFADEVEYIWKKPRTWVSVLYMMIRYLGLCCGVAIPFYGDTTFVSANVCVPLYACFYAGWLQCSNRCYAIYTLNQFALLLFLAAANFVMLLRVWAIYSRSKWILVLLLSIYVPQVVLSIVVAAVASTPQNRLVVTVQNRQVCLETLSVYLWLENAVLPMILPAIMCVLVGVEFVKQSAQLYKATRQFQPNRYMNLLCREGAGYFCVTLLFGLVNWKSHTFPVEGASGWYGMLSVVGCVPVFTLVPRFIVSLRALYASDVERRHGTGIDTAFGVNSMSNLRVVEEEERWDEDTMDDFEQGSTKCEVC